MKNLALYIHIPFCPKKCLYCDFVSEYKESSDMRKYIDAVIMELKLQAQYFFDYRVTTIFVGGGTPSFLPCGELSRVMEAITANYNLNLQEFSVEVNPVSLDYNHIKEYLSIGVNRLSVGIQAIDDRLLNILGRAYNANDARKALELAFQYFDNVSADVMVGLPEQRVIDIVNTLHEILSKRVRHISCYSLILEENTPFFEMHKQKTLALPEEDSVVNSYNIVKDILWANGFNRYEISNFAKDGYECKHNLVYWQRGEYLGIGTAAHSLIRGKRSENIRDLDEYITLLNQGKLAQLEEYTLSQEEKKEEAIMLSLRLTKGLNIVEFDKEFGTNFLTDYKQKLDKVKDYVLLENNYLRIKPDCFYVSNLIIADLI